jgi:hypothetical protein
MKRYVLYLDEYSKINEVFENDITWGGSLLGRLINSSIHSIVRRYKTNLSGIDNLVSEFKSEMKSLYANYLEDEELLVKIKALLEKIRESVYDGTPVDEFLGKNDNIGLITESINNINSVTNISDSDRKLLIEKLENFRKELIKIETKEEPIKPKNINLKDIYSLPFLLKPLIQVLGKNTIDIPMMEGMNYWDKFIVGDLSFTKDSDAFMKKFPNNKLNLATNIKNILTLPEFVQYVKTKDNVIYGYLDEAINGNAKNKSTVATNITENSNRTPILNSSKGTLWNIFSDRLTNVLPKLIQLFGDWVAVKNNEKQMQTMFYKGVQDKMERNIVFKLESQDTLENLAYSIMQISDYDIQHFKSMNTNYDNNSMYSDIIRRKLNETIAKNNIHLTKEEEEKFSKIVVSIIKRNKINENTNNISLAFEYDKINEKTKVDLVIQEVVDAWKLFFDEKDEEKWCLTKTEAVSAVKKFENKTLDLNTTTKSPDPVVRIVNIFIQAYNIYTTDYIPSGRPNGKVSLKTFRKYRYAGTGSAGSPDNPGYGKWILISAHNKFKNGIMKSLEDTELRQILANPKLTINGNKGAGTHLMNFINEMLNTNADMDRARFTLLQKYFNINEETAKPLIAPVDTDRKVKPKKEDSEEVDGNDVAIATGVGGATVGTTVGTKLIWTSVDKIVLNKNVSQEFYAFECIDVDSGKDTYISTYMISYDEVDKTLVGKFVRNSAVLADKYSKTDGKTVEELKYFPLKDSDTVIVYYFVIKSNLIEKGIEYKMNFCNIKKDASIASNVLNMKINIKQIYKLTNDDGSEYKLSNPKNKEISKNDKLVDKKDFLPYLSK